MNIYDYRFLRLQASAMCKTKTTKTILKTMRKFIFMALALLSLSLTSCSKDDDGDQKPNGSTTTGGTGTGTGTGSGSTANDPGANLDGTPGEVNKTPRTETFTFNSLPRNLAELKALPEASLDTPHKTAALCVAALCNINNNLDATWEMLEYLNGPATWSQNQKELVNRRLLKNKDNKGYITFAFFDGATPANSYQPTKPYTIRVTSTDNTFTQDGGYQWAKVFLHSGGADSPVPITFRYKESIGRWFVTNIMIALTDIRTPADKDPWK